MCSDCTIVLFHCKPSNKERFVMRYECFVSPQFSLTPLGGNVYMVENAWTATERLELFFLAGHTTQSDTPKSGQMKTDAGWKCHKSISNCQHINLLSQSALLLWDLYRTPLIKNTSRLWDIRERDRKTVRVSKWDLFNSRVVRGMGEKKKDEGGWNLLI